MLARVEKKWGYEEIIVNEPEYCGKRITVCGRFAGPGFHKHLEKKETFLVTEGAIMLQIKGELAIREELLTPGITITLGPGIWHRFYGQEEVNRFYEFSTHDEPVDTIREKENVRVWQVGS
jgi:mannose-6-phosphate isomerase-like protein (cupin superfamily)